MSLEQTWMNKINKHASIEDCRQIIIKKAMGIAIADSRHKD